jgi:hypothetical protein
MCNKKKLRKKIGGNKARKESMASGSIYVACMSLSANRANRKK